MKLVDDVSKRPLTRKQKRYLVLCAASLRTRRIWEERSVGSPAFEGLKERKLVELRSGRWELTDAGKKAACAALKPGILRRAGRSDGAAEGAALEEAALALGLSARHAAALRARAAAGLALPEDWPRFDPA